MTRHNISVPNELWARLQRAAANEGAARGRPMSVSEFIRLACEQRMGAAQDRPASPTPRRESPA